MSQCAKQGIVTSLPVCHNCSVRHLGAGRLSQRRLRPATAGALRNIKQSSARSLRLATTCSTASSVGATTSVFPAGRKQARLKLPACIWKCTAQQVIEQRDFEHDLSAAFAGGVTGVLLSDASGNDAAALYEAAIKLKGQLRGRAMLLIADRTDIVDAAEADGVIVSQKGVPAVVARRLLQQGGLVGCLVSSSSKAIKAAEEGADLIFLEIVVDMSQSDVCVTAVNISEESTPQTAAKLRLTYPQSLGGSDGAWPSEQELQSSKQQRSKMAIPVIASASDSAADASSVGNSSLDGVAVDLPQLSAAAQALRGGQASSSNAQIQGILSAVQDSMQGNLHRDRQREARADGAGQSALSGPFLTPAKEDLVEAERQLLQEMLDVLQEATPQMAELSMLTDAIKQLDELFLLVVVGEFNSGKSSVINALLGSRFLAEGILPTTNEISVLKFAEQGEEKVIQNSDGFFIRHLPAKLLQEINVVDTPGTNVILDRQQRLTEEYVPRADMVLFVMSADRPFTESEVNFLKYIRQWKKKVVFLVNKADILSNDGEVQEVVTFVADNAQRLLNVDAAKVIPISSRLALEAKEAINHQQHGNSDNRQLQQDPKWDSSRFNNLEQYIFDFLVGGASAGEKVRLKLQTPLDVADTLLSIAQDTLTQEHELVTQEAAALAAVQSQLDAFQSEMQQGSLSQRQAGQVAVKSAVTRAERFVDRTLRLTNWNTLSAYILGQGPLPVSRSFQAEILGDATMQLTNMVSEHSSWLRQNTDRQLRKYRSFAESHMQKLTSSSTFAQRAQQQAQSSSASSHGDQNSRQQWRDTHSLEDSDDDTSVSTATGLSAKQETALQAVTQFEPSGAAALLEEEIREALVGTAGTVGGAGAFGIVLTSVLQNTVEDLLAIGVASLAGYISVLGLPQKRAAAKAKLERVAENFAKDVDSKVQQELDTEVVQCLADIQEVVSPVQQLASTALERLDEAIERLAELRSTLEDLEQQAANVE